MKKKTSRFRIKQASVVESTVYYEVLLGSAILFPFKSIASFLLRLFHAFKKYVHQLLTKTIYFFTRIFKLLKTFVLVFGEKIASRIASIRRLFPLNYLIVPVCGMLCASLIFYSFSQLPNVSSIHDFPLPSPVLIYDRNNVLLYSAYADAYRVPVAFHDVPEILIDATLSTKNRHDLAQQLAKNLNQTKELSIARTMVEILTAGKIELTLHKKTIVELYFNTTPYGKGTNGVEAASEAYFGKKISQLTSKEAVYLASLPGDPDTFRERMERITTQLVADKKITLKEKEKILKQDLHILPQIPYKRAPHAVDYVLTILEKKYPHEIKSGKGLAVYTSIDLQLQNYIQQKVLEQNQLHNEEIQSEAAVVVARPKTGEVLSMIGSINYFDDKNGQNNAATSALLHDLDKEQVAQFGAAMDISKFNEKASLINLTQAYAVVANDGIFIEFNPIIHITDPQGQIVYQSSTTEGKRILSQKTAQSLQAIVSEENTDFIFSPDFVVGSWMGPFEEGASAISQDVALKMVENNDITNSLTLHINE